MDRNLEGIYWVCYSDPIDEDLARSSQLQDKDILAACQMLVKPGLQSNRRRLVMRGQG